MSTGIPDKALSRSHIDAAIKTLMRKVNVDHSHWVPYLGGYSKEFKNDPTVFFDARFPDRLQAGGKAMHPWRYILIHECVEKSLMDDLGLDYVIAHDFATAAERSAVEADGYSWADYTYALRKPIQEVTKPSKGLDSPDNLDLTPYIQERATMLPQLESAEKT